MSAASSTTAPTLNGQFIRSPELDPEEIRARWDRMSRSDREKLIASIGARFAVRECRLPAVEVALAWNDGRSVDGRLERVAKLLRG